MEIKHIHAIQWDVYTKNLWICTGDRDVESKLITSDPNFERLNVVGQGSQLWRTCNLFFEREKVFWGMDSPLTQCYIIELKRSSYTTKKICEISGPAWYGKKISNNRYLISTSVEPGVNCKDKKCKIYLSHDLKSWAPLWEYPKDSFNPVYFGFGTLSFSNGNGENDSFYLNYNAIKKNDNKFVYIKEC